MELMLSAVILLLVLSSESRAVFRTTNTKLRGGIPALVIVIIMGVLIVLWFLFPINLERNQDKKNSRGISAAISRWSYSIDQLSKSLRTFLQKTTEGHYPDSTLPVEIRRVPLDPSKIPVFSSIIEALPVSENLFNNL